MEKTFIIYLSTNLLFFITFITLLLQSFKTFENRSNNREHTHIYYTVIKREDNSSRRTTFKNVETKNSYRVKLTKLTNPLLHQDGSNVARGINPEISEVPHEIASPVARSNQTRTEKLGAPML